MGTLQHMLIVAFVSKHRQHVQSHQPPPAGGERGETAGDATTPRGGSSCGPVIHIGIQQ